MKLKGTEMNISHPYHSAIAKQVPLSVSDRTCAGRSMARSVCRHETFNEKDEPPAYAGADINDEHAEAATRVST